MHGPLVPETGIPPRVSHAWGPHYRPWACDERLADAAGGFRPPVVHAGQLARNSAATRSTRSFASTSPTVMRTPSP